MSGKTESLLMLFKTTSNGQSVIKCFKSLVTADFSGSFKYIIGFEGPHLFPHMAKILMMQLTQKVFIECFSVLRILPDLLDDEEELGYHTAIHVISSTISLHYVFYDPSG
jgi:hypothetical protein